MSGFIAGFYREIVNPLVRQISADPVLVLKTYQQDLAELEGHAESIDR